ncbi:hypothetical protein CN200_27705 [Sinorhizobium meliloti]|nr:hypothetical protein CN200_27705 [Sinorhizobium meliloti]RVN94069.1 hypothetical protein CN107_03025 [Sinorhizobium meliloti]RVN97896.1 hypothetical protein CN103_34180 [Sinorhizobium meliloti]
MGWLHDLTGQGSPLTLTLSPPAGRGDLRGRGIPFSPSERGEGRGSGMRGRRARNRSASPLPRGGASGV